MFDDDADEDQDPLAVPVPKKSRRSLGSDDPPARSSFGRVRKMKKGYSEATDPFEAADEEDPLDVTPPRQRYVMGLMGGELSQITSFSHEFNLAS